MTDMPTPPQRPPSSWEPPWIGLILIVGILGGSVALAFSLCPYLSNLYAQMGAELPRVTQPFLRSPWLFPAAVGSVGVSGIVLMFMPIPRKTKTGIAMFATILLAAGTVLYLVAMLMPLGAMMRQVQ